MATPPNTDLPAGEGTPEPGPPPTTDPNWSLPAGQGEPETGPPPAPDPNTNCTVGTAWPCNTDLPAGQGVPDPGPTPTTNPITNLPAGQDTVTTVAEVASFAPVAQQLPETGSELTLAGVGLVALVLGFSALRFARR